MTSTTISVAKQFSVTPAGRYRTDGPFPGEAFRDDFLVPALKGGSGQVIVDLDGTAGYGSSFLEEAFGGLIRLGFELQALRDRLSVKSSYPSYVQRVWSYIQDASVERSRG